jgi:hypothetical protein
VSRSPQSALFDCAHVLTRTRQSMPIRTTRRPTDRLTGREGGGAAGER